ncbi:MAG: hypothetical protein PVJ57_16045 [Phycisphaerae bacterium]
MAKRRDSLVRPAVRERIATADHRGGDVLRLDPASTMRRARWLILLLLAVSMAGLVTVRIPEYAWGPAVVWLEHHDVLAAEAGMVSRVDVCPGQQVRRGDVLVRFCDEREVAELRRIEQAYELQLVNTLRDPLDQAACRELTALRAQRTLAEELVREKRVIARYEGTVGDVRVQPGQCVAMGDILVTLLPPDAPTAEADDPRVIALLPAHHAPMLKTGLELRLEPSGHRYTYAQARVCDVGSEALGPTAIQRYLGQTLADSLALQGPYVKVEAHLDRRTALEKDGETYSFVHGMQGTARVKMHSAPAVCALVPPLRQVIDGGETPIGTALFAGAAAAALFLAVWVIRRHVVRLIDRVRRPSVPFIAQEGPDDGAAACLAMVLALRGQQVTPAAVAARVGARRGAVVDWYEAAYRYGLACRESRIGVGSTPLGRGQPDVGLLRQLPPGALVELQGELAVLERVTATGVSVLDPRRGRLHLPLGLFAGMFRRRVWTFEPLTIDAEELLEVTEDQTTEEA